MARKIGSLWQHKKDNKTYLTGSIELMVGNPTKIVIFKNEKKEANSKQPDWNIILSEEKKIQKAAEPVVIKPDEL